MDLSAALNTIQQELAHALATVDENDIEALVAALLGARRIFVAGMGRVGLAARSFVIRLMHLGLQAHWIGDATTPAVTPDDLLLVCSGSGETAPLCALAELGRRQGIQVATITRQPEATIGRLAHITVRLMASEDDHSTTARSVQPMTTLFEQSLYLLLDAIVLLLMERLGETDASMRTRHFNLER